MQSLKTTLILSSVAVALAAPATAQATPRGHAIDVLLGASLEMSYQDSTGLANSASIDLRVKTCTHTSAHRYVCPYSYNITLDYRGVLTYGESGKVVIRRGKAHIFTLHRRYPVRLSDGRNS